MMRMPAPARPSAPYGGPPRAPAGAPPASSTRAGGYLPADEDFDQEAPTGKQQELDAPAPMAKTMAPPPAMYAPAQPAQLPPPAEQDKAASEPAPEVTRTRATTLSGVAPAAAMPMKTRAFVLPEDPAERAKVEAAYAKTPYKRPPRFALWLILALVVAIIAALVWWLAS